TFLAILLGTLTAGFLSEKLNWACIVMGAASFLGLGASFFIKEIPAAKPDEPLGQKPAWLAAGMGCLMVFGLLLELHHRHWRGWETSAMAVSTISVRGCFTTSNGPDRLPNWLIIRRDRGLRPGTIPVNL